MALIAAIGLVATACDGATVDDGDLNAVNQANAVIEQCSVMQAADGSFVMNCPDGTEVTWNDGIDGTAGTAGTAGDNGIDGIDGIGQGCTVTPIDANSYLLECPDGTSAVVSSGADGTAGQEGAQGDSCYIEDGTLICPDGSQWVLSGQDDTEPDPEVIVEPEVELTLLDSLTPDEMAQIDVLRDAIEQGLTLGGDSYMNTVSLSLQQQGVVNNYEAGFSEDYSLTQEEVDTCPFVKNMANTVPTQFACDYLVDIAKQEVNGDIVAMLDANPLPQDIAEADTTGQAGFWYEQGAISGIEQHTVLVRSDLKTSLVCNVDASGEANPTADESSYEKGLIIGAQAMADAFNDWLASQGHTADYPTMSNPITVCNVNQGALDPARQNAKAGVPTTMDNNPLCPDYEPPNTATALMFAESHLQYEQGVDQGIESEYALAAVRIFKVVPCNVGDPLVVDMDGDGIELRPIHQGVNFDFYGVGKMQATAWVSNDDALLVMDRDHDGAITTGLELFGNVDQNFMDGFTHLAQMDQNADGVIDALDPGYAELMLWRDNGDGVSQPSELIGLAEVGLTEIPLNAGFVSMRSEGTRIPKAVQAGKFLVGDAYFTTAPYANPRF